jgi:hypothetical protein
MLNNFPELFVIKLVVAKRKSGKDSITVGLSREEIVCFNAIGRDAGGYEVSILSTSLR